MIIDIDSEPTVDASEVFDVCIAGGGVAGITMALTLAKAGRKVAVLEGGGEDFAERSQEMYRGGSVGREYFDLDDARLRYLGGSSNHWEGWCRTFDDWDFEGHPHIDLSGWPIRKADLAPFLDRAREIVEIKPFGPEKPLDQSGDWLQEICFRFSPPVNFKNKYLEELKSTPGVHLYLNANLVDITVDPDSGRIAGFQVKNYHADDEPRTFRAKTYVLALGGIENARIMLNANRQMPNGVGNDNGLVGRYFMEHPHVQAGYYVAKGDPITPEDEMRFLTPTRQMMREAEIGNCCVRLLPAASGNAVAETKAGVKRLLCANDIISDWARSVKFFVCPPPFDEAGLMHVAAEQVPNIDSRVFLGDEEDRFGLKRVVLNWRLSEIDRRTIRETVFAVAAYFARTGIGAVKLEDWLHDEDAPVPDVGTDPWLGAGWHHMGTTRMASSAAHGVVDANCRVFGVDNLFIAGSSCFSTSSHANPTLTIVQLALRLADHLAIETKA